MISKDVKFSGFSIGTVKKINTKNRKVAVFLPKFMPAIPETGSKNIVVNYGNPSIDIDHREYIKSTDYIWVKARDVLEPMPAVDSKVLVWFLEGEPWSGYWEKFNPNGDYSVISSEKYKELFTLQVGDKTAVISEGDIVKINIPNNSKVSLVKNDKNIQFNILNNNQYYSKTEVDNLISSLLTRIVYLENK